MGPGSTKKRQRPGSSGRPSSSSPPDLPDQKLDPKFAPVPGGFNDAATADVVLRLSLDPDAPPPPFFSPPGNFSEVVNAVHPTSLDLHLHSSVLRRSHYFSTLLSSRWRSRSEEGGNDNAKVTSHLNLKVPPSSRCPNRPFDSHVSVIRLLYSLDFQSAIGSVSEALDVLHVALELLFDECVTACVRFLEAVPWTEEEERSVLKVIPFLRHEESQDLLARIEVPESNEFDHSAEDMLHDLILSTIHNYPTVTSVKGFTARVLTDFSPRISVQKALDRAFLGSLETVRNLLAEYASPDFRVAGNHDETEAIQRLNLHGAVLSTRKLLWLVERMIDLGVADNAVQVWSEQASFAADLQKAFGDDTCRNIAPGLPTLMMRCTVRLSNAVAVGSVLANKEVRLKLVKNWLPVLNKSREFGSPVASSHAVYQEMEQIFLRIISTLPLSDSQELLQSCLAFSIRGVDDCSHLLSAFNTWLRRANRSQTDENRN